jgi:hypothetical protein
MTNSRLITRSACALGAAILATTALQSTPAQARGKAGGHTSSSAHVTTHKGFRIAKETTGQLHARAIPRGSRPPFDPGHIQFDPGNNSGGGKQVSVDPWTKPNGVSGGGPGLPTAPIPPIPLGGNKTPPILSGTPTPAPTPLPPGGNKTPPILSGTPTPAPTPLPPGGNKTPPILSGTPTPAPTPLPPGGNKTPPILSGTPTPAPIPIPIPSGSSPSPGYGTGTTYTHQYGQVGVYADTGTGGGGYEPCLLFKSNYDRTGNVYWLNRYRICLSQH